MFNIALLGFGTVGQGTCEVLTENSSLIERRTGEKINIKYILDLRDFPEHPMGDRVVHDFNIILNDPEVRLVAEMMGGSHPAYDFSVTALKAGKHVVTSNKEVVANFGTELLHIAAESGFSSSISRMRMASSVFLQRFELLEIFGELFHIRSRFFGTGDEI